ncbi:MULTISPECIES: hypothetical protein [Flavobacteriaceae]|uniref:hypothetical protein n=1 Tax=Flavobacteriaceae TaxID=49546 RepID=UPI002349245E|nr:hypothetical protein [Muricauda sp. SP22]MDC6362389.1 hypothetical protein [Muricauda sp. SP22]
MAKEFNKSDLEQIIGLQLESLQILQKAMDRLQLRNEHLVRDNLKLRDKIAEYE